jgi:DNA repair exonuclease SbcCD ATPase subunit
MPQMSLTLLEIIILMLGAIGLGITIHFFIVSKKTLRQLSPQHDQRLEEWKLRYLNDMERKEIELQQLRKLVDELKEKHGSLDEENDNLRYKLERLKEAKENEIPVVQQDYIRKLEEAQQGLVEQNRKIADLLKGIDFLKTSSGGGEDLRQANEELLAQLEELQLKLESKEQEIREIRQASQVSSEMNSMLDNAYREFNLLQEKIVKLEGQVSSSQKLTLEYEDLREGSYKASRDLEEQRLRLTEMINENRGLQMEVSETSEKLRESNFQRQQLQKRVAYLEELNQDLQSVADANRKLESQLKRIGELESLLQVMAEERINKA